MRRTMSLMERATQQMDVVIDHLDASAKRYPIKRLAPELKTEVTPARAESSLRGELNQTVGCKLGMVTAVQIMAKTRDLSPLDLIESVFHRVAFELPRVSPGSPAPVMELAAKLSKEFSEAIGETGNALADGTFCDQDAERCLKEVDDLIEVCIQFKATMLYLIEAANPDGD